MGNTQSLAKRHDPWRRLEEMALVSLVSFDERGIHDMIHEIAARDPSPSDVEYGSAIQDIWRFRLALPRANLTVIDADNSAGLYKFESGLKDLVRANADGIVFILDGVNAQDDHMQDVLLSLHTFVSGLAETENSVVLVLVNHAEEEGAILVPHIEQTITNALVKHNRGSQRFAVWPVNGNSYEGLQPAFEWFVEELNKAMEVEGKPR